MSITDRELGKGDPFLSFAFRRRENMLQYAHAKESVPAEKEKTHARPRISQSDENTGWTKSDKKTSCQGEKAHQCLILHASKSLPYQGS